MVMPRRYTTEEVLRRVKELEDRRRAAQRLIPTPEELEAERAASTRYAVPPEEVAAIQERVRPVIKAPAEFAREAAGGLSTPFRRQAPGHFAPPLTGPGWIPRFLPPLEEPETIPGAIGRALGRGVLDPTMGEPLTGSFPEAVMLGLPLPTAGLGMRAPSEIAQAVRYGTTAARVKVPQAVSRAAPTIRRALAEERGGMRGHLGRFGGSRNADEELAFLEGLQQSDDIVRPPANKFPWVRGITNQELARMAQQEGVNPYQADWFDSLDTQVIAELKQRRYKLGNVPTKTEIAQRLRAVRAELRETQPPQQTGVMQTGMGIGERPPQGGLFENLPHADIGNVPLVNREQMIARQSRRAELARGQTEMAAPGGLNDFMQLAERDLPNELADELVAVYRQGNAQTVAGLADEFAGTPVGQALRQRAQELIPAPESAAVQSPIAPKAAQVQSPLAPKVAEVTPQGGQTVSRGVHSSDLLYWGGDADEGGHVIFGPLPDELVAEQNTILEGIAKNEGTGVRDAVREFWRQGINTSEAHRSPGQASIRLEGLMDTQHNLLQDMAKQGKLQLTDIQRPLDRYTAVAVQGRTDEEIALRFRDVVNTLTAPAPATIAPHGLEAKPVAKSQTPKTLLKPPSPAPTMPAPTAARVPLSPGPAAPSLAQPPRGLAPSPSGALPPGGPPPVSGAVTPPITATGRFWLPEPPRAIPEYMAAARKGQGAVFRGKKGAFETIEEGRQMVLKARDVGRNTIPRVASYIQQAGDTVKEFGIDAQGMVTRVGNPQNRSLAINDVLSNFTHYALTPKQLEIAKRHGFVYQEALKLARSYGVQISELGGPDDFWQYIARRVKSKLNPLTGEYETPPGVIGGFKMGAKIGAQKERVFDEMAQGVNLGLLYENPDQVVMAHIQGIYRLIGNKQAENLIKPLTRQITETAPLQFGERAVHEPALRSRGAAVEIANAIDKVFTPEQEMKALRVAADVSGAMVGQVAALDVSAPFIQGLPLLGHDLKQALKGRRSAVWFKSYGHMWQAALEPNSINKFREANSELYKRFIEASGMTGQSEYVAGLPVAQRALGKIPLVGRPLREVYKQTWGRFGQAYSDFLEVGKVKMFEQLEPVWRRNGDNIYELGAVANRMAGGVSSEARGVGANRRLIERSLGFAPNYLRASMLLMRDLMSRGATAREVQGSIAAFLGAGAAIYYAEEKVRGHEPKMKPWPKRLGGDGAEAFTAQVGETRMGLGSWMYGMIKMLSEVGAVAVDDPDSLVVWDDRHPMVRFLKTKRGPAVGLAQELATGRNFFGKKFDSPDDYLMRIAESFVPIAGQSMISQKPRGGLAQVVADVAGMRTFPYSLRSRWTDEDPAFKAYSTIPSNEQERKTKKVEFPVSRDDYLARNPEVDAKLYILGERESIIDTKEHPGTQTRALIVQLMRENRIKPEDVPGLREKEYESDDRKKLRLAITNALKALEGQPVSSGAAQPRSVTPSVTPSAAPVATPTPQRTRSQEVLDEFYRLEAERTR